MDQIKRTTQKSSISVSKNGFPDLAWETHINTKSQEINQQSKKMKWKYSFSMLPG